MNAADGRRGHRRHLLRLKKLASQSSERRKEQKFLIEGATLVGDALGAGLAILEVLVEDGRAGEAEVAVAKGAKEAGAEVLQVPEGWLSQVGASVTAPPMLAVAEIPEGWDGAEVGEAGEEGGEGSSRENSSGETNSRENCNAGFSLLLFEISDPANAGAILRCAEGAGAREVIFLGNCVDPWGPKVVRASAGSLFRLAQQKSLRRRRDAMRYLEGLSKSGRQIVATAAREGEPYCSLSYKPGVAILMGNESHGLPEDIAGLVSDFTHIPLSGEIESLNVGMAAAVVCFEAARQLGSQR